MGFQAPQVALGTQPVKQDGAHHPAPTDEPDPQHAIPPITARQGPMTRLGEPTTRGWEPPLPDPAKR